VAPSTLAQDERNCRDPRDSKSLHQSPAPVRSDVQQIPFVRDASTPPAAIGHRFVSDDPTIKLERHAIAT
jgi:hypothetical protein